MRSQILTFEDVLRRAIEVAGEELSTQVKQQLNAPIPIQFGFEPAVPVVRGWPIPSYGYHFAVHVPNVTEAGMMVYRMWVAPGQPLRPAEPGSRPVASSSVVNDDPMGPPASAPAENGAAGFDPIVVFQANVRTALIDAILNNPGVLTLRDADWLAVSTTGVGQSPAARLSPRSARVTLYVRGADLLALRDGKLTREEARARIRESSF
jgi:hypothetical protein